MYAVGYLLVHYCSLLECGSLSHFPSLSQFLVVRCIELVDVVWDFVGFASCALCASCSCWRFRFWEQLTDKTESHGESLDMDMYRACLSLYVYLSHSGCVDPWLSLERCNNLFPFCRLCQHMCVNVQHPLHLPHPWGLPFSCCIFSFSISFFFCILILLELSSPSDCVALCIVKCWLQSPTKGQ